MGNLAKSLLALLERGLNGTPAEQEEEARILAECRAANCPNCGDDNTDLVFGKLDGGGTRPRCAVVLDMDGHICGCQHQYHAA